MRNHIDKWKNIATRIEGIENLLNNFIGIAKIYAASPTNNGKDKLSIFSNAILPEYENIMKEILNWKNENELPSEVQNIIDKFNQEEHVEKAKKYASVHDFGNIGSDSSLTSCQAVLPLFSLKIQIDYLLKDLEYSIRTTTELAFEHLRRTIIVDENVRNKWQAAENEVACEKMGALHLLSHGIWAFKIDTAKARTDLIYQEPLDKYNETISRSSIGLILTEWKKVKKSNQIENKASEARNQLTKYAYGALSGIELKRTRYVILVTEKDERPPEDHLEHGILYRHIIIPVSPEVPSKSARKKISAA